MRYLKSGVIQKLYNYWLNLPGGKNNVLVYSSSNMASNGNAWNNGRGIHRADSLCLVVYFINYFGL